MWECHNCHETVEDNLDICWNCGYTKDGAPPAGPNAFVDPRREPEMRKTGVLQEDRDVTIPTQQVNSAEVISWARVGAVSSAIFTGIALLFLWAIPQFTSDQVWTIDISTTSVSIPLRLLGLWNGIVALAYFGLVPGLANKNLESYKHALQLAQLNLFLTYFQTTQYGQVSLSDIFIMGGNFSLLMGTWGGKTLIARQEPPLPAGSPPIDHEVDVGSIMNSNVDTDVRIGYLLSTLFDSNRGARIPVQVEEALVSIGSPAVEPLINSLRQVPDHVRFTVASALGRIGDPRAIDELERLARVERNNQVGFAARSAIAMIREQMKNQ